MGSWVRVMPVGLGAFGQLQGYGGVKQGGRAQDALAEIQAKHRVVSLPIPVRLQIQTGEQVSMSGEGVCQGSDQQALAEAARASEKIHLPVPRQLFDQRRFVSVAIIAFPKLVEGLNANRQWSHRDRSRDRGAQNFCIEVEKFVLELRIANFGKGTLVPCPIFQASRFPLALRGSVLARVRDVILPRKNAGLRAQWG